MMNREQAIEYGKRVGVQYYVKNSRGWLLGGYTTKEAAEDARKRWQKEYDCNPWNKGVSVYIEKA